MRNSIKISSVNATLEAQNIKQDLSQEDIRDDKNIHNSINPIICEVVEMPINSGVVENLEIKLKCLNKIEQYRYKTEAQDHTESNSFIEDPIMSPRNPDLLK